ncbi:hypothetical protein [uncultured Jatrophihabitans sp.]|uniref:hypothetical protein n=1 Tax=uncultured Jatrophihabitans sp. TaxID=1610747 RepID=UPI0035CB8C9B
MTTEQQLGDLFDDQARQAPAPDFLLDGAMRKVRARRRRIVAAESGAAVLGAAVLLAAALSIGGPTPTHTGPVAMGTVPAGLAGQPLADPADQQGSCRFEYSPTVVARRLDFALDGTVVAIGSPVSQRPGDPEPWDYVGVTFQVNEWFKGGDANTFTVDMPESGKSSLEGDGSPSEYSAGTRLLVSGMARSGGADPLAYPVAWVGCGGFTLYYSQSAAGDWRAANR